MDKAKKPYKKSTLVTFRRRCKDRMLHLSDMRETMLIRYLAVIDRGDELSDQFCLLLPCYDALIEAEKAFLVFLRNTIKEHDNG